MLDRERERILKKKWTNVQEFAEELYTLLSDDTNPVEMGSGIEMAPGERPPILLKGVDDDFPVLQARRRDGSTIDIVIQNGDLNIIDTPADGQGPSTTSNASKKAAQSAASSFPGKLIAYLGDNQYTVSIYPHGLSGDSRDVEVTQLEGDPAFPHRTDGTRWAIVVQTSDKSYYMWVPVWGRKP